MANFARRRLIGRLPRLQPQPEARLRVHELHRSFAAARCYQRSCADTLLAISTFSTPFFSVSERPVALDPVTVVYACFCGRWDGWACRHSGKQRLKQRGAESCVLAGGHSTQGTCLFKIWRLRHLFARLVNPQCCPTRSRTAGQRAPTTQQIVAVAHFTYISAGHGTPGTDRRPSCPLLGLASLLSAAQTSRLSTTAVPTS